MEIILNSTRNHHVISFYNNMKMFNSELVFNLVYEAKITENLEKLKNTASGNDIAIH